MGPYRAAALSFLLLTTASVAQTPGWHYSPLPGEGDRATLGCDRDSTATNYACLAVRCEDDFSVGVHVHTSRHPDDLGTWEMTLDRENKQVVAEAAEAPYGGRIVEEADWLLQGLRHGTFVYLRHADDEGGAFRFIDLTGSLFAINAALAWCAPRVPETAEPNDASGVDPATSMENDNGSSPAGTQ